MEEGTIEFVLKRIRQLRGDKGLSQEFLAEELGVCQTTYGRIENGRQKISGEQLLKVAKIRNYHQSTCWWARKL